MSTLRLIEEIYRTGSETHDWPALLGRLATYIGVRSGLVGITDLSTGRCNPTVYTYGLDEDPLHTLWVDEFNFENPWTDDIPPPKPGQIMTGTDTVPLNELRGLPLYADVFSPLEIDDALVTLLSTEGSRVLALAMYSDRAHGPFEQSDREQLRPLVPHLLRAAAIESMLLRARVQENVNRMALDKIGFAIFAISALEAEPLNARAEALVAEGDGLISRSGRLRATDTGSNEVLQSALLAAGGGLSIPSVCIATPFPLRRTEQRLPLTCWTIPISHRSETGLARLVKPGNAILFVGSPESRPELASETVARLFGLTPAEARVAAAIASGETTREYAERQGFTQNTVRWTLKQVQSKLGVRRQLDIASVVLRATPGMHR